LSESAVGVEQQPAPKRKRGRPPKHGLYSKVLDEEKRAFYEEALSLGTSEKLEHTIALIVANIKHQLATNPDAVLGPEMFDAYSRLLSELRLATLALHKLKGKEADKKEFDLARLLSDLPLHEKKKEYLDEEDSSQEEV